jgi:hypothetical protein
MTESLARQTPKTWSNPDQIAFIVGEIGRHRQDARIRTVSGSNQPIAEGNRLTSHLVDARKVQRDSARKVIELAYSMKDYYLVAGVLGFYSHWEKFGDYLLTPKAERQPLKNGWTDVAHCIGTVCLAARAAETDLTVQFNEVDMTATPDTMPGELRNQYHLDICRKLEDPAAWSA